MIDPSPAQWRQIIELIVQWDELPRSQVEVELAQLKADAVVTQYLRLNYRLPGDPFQFSSGDRIDSKYVVREKVGQGGMGVVYLAVHEVTGKEVALKLLQPGLASQEALTRFEQEIQILGRLDYRGIVRIFDAALHKDSLRPGGCLFYAMEYVRGETLGDYARKAELGIRESLELILEVCESLRYAHDRRIIHRDLKPSNIIVQSDGLPVLLDFGLARFIERSVRPREEMNQGSVRSGTLLYMSPEQAAPALYPDSPGESLDIYSTGVILYELLANRPPIGVSADASAQAIRQAIVEQEARPLRELNPQCPASLESAVAKALRKDPAQRYQTAGAFARALRLCLEEVVAGRPRRPAKGWRAAPEAVLPGSQWIMERQVGEGAVGEVWVGFHRRTRERRAFKFCTNRDRLQLLKRETTLFRLLSQKIQDHPHIARLYEVSFDDEPFFLMFEFAALGDLKTWLKSLPTPVSAELAVEITAQIADALQAAHEAGVLHRDVKPSNILVFKRSDGGVTAKLSDFGIGQVISREMLLHLTHPDGFTLTGEPGVGAGTRTYMAPELLVGKAATTRSDIYALGVVLYQLLAGDLEFPLTAEWQRNVADPFLREDLARCLYDDPAQRYGSAAEFAARLRDIPARRIQLGRQEAAAAAAVELRRRRTRNLRVTAAMGGIAAAMALGVHFRNLDRTAALGRAESLQGEATELKNSQRSGQWTNSGTKVRGAIEQFAKAGVLESRLGELRSAAIASASLPDVVSAGSGKFGTVAVAFCPTARTFAAIGQNFVLVVKKVETKVETGLVLATLPFEKGLITAAEFSPDGRFLLALATHKSETVAHLWTVADGKRVWMQSGAFRCAAFCRDGSQLALAEGDGAVQVFDLKAPEREIQRLRPAVSMETDFLTWSEGARHLAAGSRSGLNVLVWDMRRASAPPVQLFHPAGPIATLAWDLSRQALATGSVNGEVVLWEEPFGEEYLSLKLHGAAVTGLSLDLRHGKILSRGEDQVLRLASLDEREGVTLFPCPSCDRLAVVVSPEESGAGRAFLWNGGQFEEWSVRPGRLRRAIFPPRSDNTIWGRPALATVGPGLAVALKNQQVTFYDLLANTVVGRLHVPGMSDLALASPEGGALIVGGKQGLFRLSLEVGGGAFPTLRVGAAEALLAPEGVGALGSDGAYFTGIVGHGEHLHDLQGDPLKTLGLSLQPEKILQSRDGGWCAVKDRRTKETQVFQMPLTTGVPFLSVSAHDFAFAEGGKLLAGEGGKLHVYSLNDGKKPRMIDLVSAVGPEVLAVMKDFPVCAVGNRQWVHLINHESGETLLRLESRNAETFRSLGFSPDNTRLLGLKSNGLLETWDLPEIAGTLRGLGLGAEVLDRAFTNGVPRPPGRTEPWRLIAAEFVPDGKTNSMVSRLERTEEKLTQSPNDRALLLEAGRIRYQLGDPAGAIMYLEAAGQEHLGAGEVEILKACREATGKPVKAGPVYKNSQPPGHSK